MQTSFLSLAFNKIVGTTPGQRFRRAAAVMLLVAIPVAITTCHNDKKADNDNTGATTQPQEDTPQEKFWEDPNKLCLQGCPAGSPHSNKIVPRSIYVLSNNGDTKFADWVAYKITPQTIGKPNAKDSTQTRSWHRDPDLPKDETLSPKDYEGARDALGIDRGHQAPFSSLSALPDWKDANDLSNITPQSIDLNEGAWENLERAERNLALKQGFNVHSLTGTLYERTMKPLPHARLAHKIPSGYWKVLAVQQGDEILVASFIMDQKLSRDADFCASAVTVRVVESHAKLNLFPNMKQSAQDKIETAPGKLLNKLGCKSS